MAATLCLRLLSKRGWLPITQSVRHGSKAVTRHKKPMHFLKQKLMAVTQYIPPTRTIPPDAYPRQIESQEHSPLTLLYRKSLRALFEDCRMIAVAQNNSCNNENMNMLKHRLHKHGVGLKFFPSEVLKSFLKDGVYCNMALLVHGPTVLIVSKEPKAREMLMTLRSYPQITLLGACIENRLLSAQGILAYSKLPPVTVAQGELVSCLSMLSANTAAMLQRHPAHLSALLGQHVKQQDPAGGGGPAAEEAAKAEEAT